MTDEQELQDAPENQEVEELEQTDAVDGEVNEDAEEVEESSTSEDAEPKQKPWFTKRIDELTANWREEQRRNAQLMEKVLEMQKPSQPEPETTQNVGEPKLDSFETYEDYVAALAEYKADQKIQAWEQSRQQETQAQAQERQRQEFEARADDFRQQHPDYDVVALNPQLPVSAAMAEAIQMADNGPELLYTLGQNPAEAARLAALPPLQAAIELGRMTTAPKPASAPKTRTNAPPPVEPLSGGSGSRTIDPERMTADEWRVWRDQQLGNK